MNVKIKFTLFTCGVILFSSFLYLFFRAPAAPWQDSGRFVLAIRTVPSQNQDTLMVLGIDNVELYTESGKTVHASVLSRRVQLSPTGDTIEVLLDTNIQVGTYTGLGFEIKSPELRNAWEETAAPDHITLLHETVHLPAPYTVTKDDTSLVLLSFETLTAVHEVDGTKQYLPVIQIETRHTAQLLQDEQGSTRIDGGSIENSATFGMDWDGSLRRNYRARVPEPEEKPIEEEVIVEFETTIDTASTTATTSESETLTDEPTETTAEETDTSTESADTTEELE